MTVVNTETSEIVEPLTRDEAERLSIRIGARLDTIADNYTAVMPMIREAITRNAHEALGYRSAGEFAAERFGDALSKLDPAMRREVVKELTDAGLSSRAIAPVVGTSDRQVRRDISGGTHVPPAHTSPADLSTAGSADAATSETQPERVEPPSAPRPVVVGIDGKTYTPPKPRPLSVVRPQSGDEQAIELVETIARNLTVLSQMAVPERRAALIDAWPKALGKVSPAQTDRFTPEQMRAVADGLHDLADEWSN